MSKHREREHVYVGTCWCGESADATPPAALVERATPESGKRYCEMCDEWFKKTVCPECGMPTRKAER